MYTLLTLQPYAVSVGITMHSVHLGLLDPSIGRALTLASAAVFITIFTLVRSGWSQRFADPVLTFPHALISIALCMAAYTTMGPYRANVMILIAEIIVMAMVRLRPNRILLLGLLSVSMLAVCILVMSYADPIRYPPVIGGMHFLVAGAALLTLSLIAKQVSDIRMRISRHAHELSNALVTLRQMATNDMLTGLLNRRVMTELAEHELKQLERVHGDLCIALIDIDHFKRINDRFGHQAGDTVLKGVAQYAQAQLRQVDKFARWGGEEFLLMLPCVNETDAMAALERLRAGVEALTYSENPELKATFSAGIARAKVGESLEHLIERADEALYLAKGQGRNRCRLAQKQLTATHAALPNAQETPT
ncbi:MAG: diguanylate cyclase [Rugosibacter sp.]|nr:diguanylate cyclase [Rugosibacter sp.]